MGRPPSNGGPSFRFNNVEVAEMESILQAHNCVVPGREVLETLAERFSGSAERSGKVEVAAKQVWNWFQNRRYAIRAKNTKPYVPGQVTAPPVVQANHGVARNIPQPAPSPALKSTSQVPHTVPASSSSAQSSGKNGTENPQMEFEAKSARDGAWYDVASFLSHRALEKADPEAQVRFAGFGPEEDEWVDIRKHVRQRSLPCESSECVAVCPGDLILCFQEGKEQALYFDAHVLDAQRRRHDVRGCRCRFLVRYDHDQSEEIVPLKKICRRPETDYRLQQLQDVPVNVTSQNDVTDGNATSETFQKQDKPEDVPIAKESNVEAPVEAVTATNAPMEIESDARGQTTDAANPTELASGTNITVGSDSDAGASATTVTTNSLPVESVKVTATP